MNTSSIRPEINMQLAALIFITSLLAMLAPTIGHALQTTEAANVITYARLQGASDMVMDSRGILYVANHRTGEVHCVMPGGEIISLAKGLPRPSCLALDRNRDLYVGSHSGTIHRLAADGSLNQVYFGPEAIRSMLFDRDGNLLVITASQDVVFRIPHHSLAKVPED